MTTPADEPKATSPAPGKGESGPHATIEISGNGKRFRFTLSGFAKYAAPAMSLVVALGTLIAGRVQHTELKDDSNRAVKKADETEAKTDDGYTTLAIPQNKLAARVQTLADDQAKMAIVLQAILAARPNLVPGAEPQKIRKAVKPTPKLAKQAAAAVEQLPAIQARPAEQPAPKPVPEKLPEKPPVEAAQPQPPRGDGAK